MSRSTYDREQPSIPPPQRTEIPTSFQAYLDNIEAKTGKSPNEFIALARERGYDDPSTKAGVIVDWLKRDFDLGRDHAMALVRVIKSDAAISDKQVGSSGVHREEVETLELDGQEGRP